MTSKELCNLASVAFMTSSHTNFCLIHSTPASLLFLQNSRHTFTLVLLPLFHVPGTVFLQGASHLAPSFALAVSLKVTFSEVFSGYPTKKI